MSIRAATRVETNFGKTAANIVRYSEASVLGCKFAGTSAARKDLYNLETVLNNIPTNVVVATHPGVNAIQAIDIKEQNKNIVQLHLGTLNSTEIKGLKINKPNGDINWDYNGIKLEIPKYGFLDFSKP